MTFANFGGNWLRGFGVAGAQIWLYYIGLHYYP